MSPDTASSSRILITLSLAFGLVLAGCAVSSPDDDELDSTSDEGLGADEAALYNGWAPVSPEQHVIAIQPSGHPCGDGIVTTNEECDDANHTAGDGCNTNCRREPGYTCSGSPSACAEIDECKASTAACGSHASCRNLPGSFTCDCQEGFAGATTCADIDECALGTHSCDANATCTNEPGGFSCACNAGFSGDGVSCKDIDECAFQTSCYPGAVCENNEGGFRCACAEGYALRDGLCADVDECADGSAQCSPSAACTNLDGGYACACRESFEGDGFECKYTGNP